MKKMINTAFVYMILGLVAGVFYREFTKFMGFEGLTTCAPCTRICWHWAWECF